jgi:hypothetical protein
MNNRMFKFVHFTKRNPTSLFFHKLQKKKSYEKSSIYAADAPFTISSNSKK